MTTQYLRYVKITAEGSESIDVSDLRCRFEIHPTPVLSPAQCVVKITNLSADHAQKFVKKKYKKLMIEAGYEENYGVIFKGDIVWGIYGRESPTDTLTTIYANDGAGGHNYGTVHTTLPPGSTPKDHLDVALQAMGQFGVTRGYIGANLSSPTYSRAVTLFGMARDVIRGIARSSNSFAFYDRGELTMVPAGKSRNDGMVKLNSGSGLIGMPTQTTEGIFARCLINPQLRRMGKVYIDQKDVIPGAPNIDPATGSPALTALAPVATDGVYTIMKIDIFGDTRGQPWYFDLALFATHETPPLASDIYTGFVTQATAQ